MQGFYRQGRVRRGGFLEGDRPAREGGGGEDAGEGRLRAGRPVRGPGRQGQGAGLRTVRQGRGKCRRVVCVSVVISVTDVSLLPLYTLLV